MAKQVIITPHPPKTNYSKGIKAGQFIFVAGIPGNEHPDTGEKIKGIEAQTRQCFEIIKEILTAAGSSLNDVVNVTVYLKNPDDFAKMNEVSKLYFPKDPPARATLLAGFLLPDMLVEIQCIAYHS